MRKVGPFVATLALIALTLPDRALAVACANLGVGLDVLGDDCGARLDGRMEESQAGVALAKAMLSRDLPESEASGFGAHLGSFEGAHALGVELVGVLAHDLLAKGDRAAIVGGFGVGFAHGPDDGVVGGRIGVQWTR
jgi:hypothetical protein